MVAASAVRRARVASRPSSAGKVAFFCAASLPALLSLEATRTRLSTLSEAMRDALAPFGARADALAALGRAAVERKH